METLFIDRRGTDLKINHGRLRLSNSTHKMDTSIPLQQLRALVISCDCQLSANTLYHLAKNEVALICLNPRDIEASFMSVPNSHGNVQRRVTQYHWQQNTSLALRMAQLLVRQKCRQQRRHLRQLMALRSERRHQLAVALHRCPVIPRDPQNIAQLMGIEGATARAYFQGFSLVFASSLGFEKRQKRPATDPVNSCLSFAYTLLYFEALRAAYAFGLEPMLGCLHQNSYQRASLVCDWIELHRVAVDRWVYERFHTRQLREDHFEEGANGAYLLTKTGRQHFFEHWATLLPSIRGQLRREGRWFSRYIDSLAVTETQ